MSAGLSVTRSNVHGGIHFRIAALLSSIPVELNWRFCWLQWMYGGKVPFLLIIVNVRYPLGYWLQWTLSYRLLHPRWSIGAPGLQLSVISSASDALMNQTDFPAPHPWLQWTFIRFSFLSCYFMRNFTDYSERDFCMGIWNDPTDYSERLARSAPGISPALPHGLLNAVCLLHHYHKSSGKPPDTELTLLITVNIQTHQCALYNPFSLLSLRIDFYWLQWMFCWL